MPRFFVDIPLSAYLSTNTSLVLPSQVAHHALRVLRLQVNDQLTLFNGQGGEYQARLIDTQHPTVRITHFDTREAELPFAVTVAQSLASGDKMDWVIEKAVELGASAIQPVTSERSVIRLNDQRAAKRRAHWQALAQAACAQCGRNRVAVIGELLSLQDYLQKSPEALKIILSPHCGQKLASLPRPEQGQAIHLLVGPEGGWTIAELQAAECANFLPIHLGPRVLRTETAAAAALATMAALWEQ